MRSLYLILLVFSAHIALSQSFENVKAVTQNNKVFIYYDLISPNNDQTYAVKVYGSHDNFTNPIKFVTGDVGNSVHPGVNKRVEWSVEAELTSYNGDISFELRGVPNAMKLSFRSPVAGRSVKRGKKTEVVWQGGSSSQLVRINLFKDEQLISPVAETNNTGKYTWTVPKKLKKGTYQLKLTSGSETISSGGFKIKKRTPFIVKMLPIVAVAGAVYFLMPGETPDDGGGGGPTDEDLPDAPGPPGN